MKHQIANRKSKVGFTLIELLVVVTIIVVLLALLVPSLDKAIYQAELAVCAAQLKGMATGASTYAIDYKRHYPIREGLSRSSTGWWLPHMLRDDQTGSATVDDRRIVDGYIDARMFVDPLCQPLDLSLGAVPEGFHIAGSRAAWYGWQYTGHRGMKRIGQRWESDYIDAEGNERRLESTLIASDYDRTISPGAGGPIVLGSHPDQDAGRMTTNVLKGEGGFLGTQVDAWYLSRWILFGSMERGPLDMNFADADGSVARFDRVDWNEWQADDSRMARVPNYSSNANEGVEWHMVPRQ